VKEKIMQVRTLLRVFALVPGLLGWGALPVCAQASSADIQGQVIDASGSAIAGAKVSLRNTDTGVTSSTIATDGSYSFPAVNPGHYALNVAATGFSAATVSGLTIQLGMHVQQDIRLQIGNTTELVTRLPLSIPPATPSVR
jgi:protocatechuate 3,4-dioxygenase beta subunit